jgi:hypothetical protein
LQLFSLLQMPECTEELSGLEGDTAIIAIKSLMSSVPARRSGPWSGTPAGQDIGHLAFPGDLALPAGDGGE